MSRSALKDVLLDLKKQMRNKRASSYGKKNGPKAEPKLDADVDDVESFDKNNKAADLAPKASGKAEKVDFSDEIKKFMKNKRVAKAEPGTADGFGFMANGKPEAKKKGK